MLVERLEGSFHRTDSGFSLFDAQFNALFDGVILKIDKICLNALRRKIANDISDSC